MKYVLDTSVAIKLVILEVDSGKAVRLLDDYANGIHDLLSVDLFPIECGHVLMMAERKGKIMPGEAVLFHEDIVNNSPTLNSSIPLLHRAIEIALDCRESVYDCLYVALAEREGCEMVTADLKLIKATAFNYPFLIPLSSFP